MSLRRPPLTVLAAGAALCAALASPRCTSVPEADVLVTSLRSDVAGCIGMSAVATSLNGPAGEKDLRVQAADLGGNVLLRLGERRGEVYWCEHPPVHIGIASYGAATPTPRSRTP